MPKVFGCELSAQYHITGRGKAEGCLYGCRTADYVKLAIELLKEDIDNEIFWEWCDTLIECQDNSNQKISLQPLAARLSDIRIVNAELANMLMQPRKEVFTMIGLVLANYPLIFFLNADWFSVLTDTLFGQIVNCIVAVTIVIVIALTYKYTQPIEFKR